MKKVVVFDTEEKITDFFNTRRAGVFNFGDRITKVTIEVEPFDWAGVYREKVERDKLVLALLEGGVDIAAVESKSLTELKEISGILTNQ